MLEFNILWRFILTGSLLFLALQDYYDDYDRLYGTDSRLQSVLAIFTMLLGGET